MASKKKPDLMDLALGRRVRATRLGQRMSQETLAAMTGVTFQQIQKYERGATRISFSMLVKIAGALRMKTETLIAGIDQFGVDGAAEQALPPELTGLLLENRNVKLLRRFTPLPTRLQACVLELVDTMAGADGERLAAAG